MLPPYIFNYKYFNPRSHKGSDIVAYGLVAEDYKFQSTLPQGERPSTIDVLLCFVTFQSTLPQGERQQCSTIYFSFYCKKLSHCTIQLCQKLKNLFSLLKKQIFLFIFSANLSSILCSLLIRTIHRSENSHHQIILFSSTVFGICSS